MILEIKRLDKDLPKPYYQSDGAAGIDLYLKNDVQYIEWHTGKGSVLVDTGIAVAIPKGYVGLVRSRSGVAVKKGLDVAAGVIDSDYRGEVKVLLRAKVGNILPDLKRGERIAQLLIMPCPQVMIEDVEELSATKRFDGGFGSTGE